MLGGGGEVGRRVGDGVAEVEVRIGIGILGEVFEAWLWMWRWRRWFDFFGVWVVALGFRIRIVELLRGCGRFLLGRPFRKR